MLEMLQSTKRHSMLQRVLDAGYRYSMLKDTCLGLAFKKFEMSRSVLT